MGNSLLGILTDPVAVSAHSIHGGYSPEAMEILKKEGPKYQYGKGCLSDGVAGDWLARVCGLPEPLDADKVKSHLASVYQYNFKKDLSQHSNPERPGYALGKEGGLVLCTWPKGGELSLPFIFSPEVWTGVEYEVASHLIFEGRVKEGLDIVRTTRSRYDGIVRNPFDEYECGHWYARAMSSYALIEGKHPINHPPVV
jgi:Glycosyl-hydrolase family 116, catalytic region